MTTETEAAEDKLELPALKVTEPKVNVVTPWTDDKLKRRKIADRLTTIIEDQEAPFVISLDGRWGTGKTFLLKRWQQELVNDKYQAIYFNAWEDDFCDDPLLAIIGQLSEHFSEGKFKELALKITDIALGLLTKQLIGEAVKLEDVKPQGILREYHEQRKKKVEVKGQLTELAAEVRIATDHPLIFIIDELDRCRPTFAIELLERVKHIFDVPNIVFVFGVNRSELVKSLESIYGDIEAGVYLRRFFDMEFILPEANPANFCSHLVQRYQLGRFFTELSTEAGTSLKVNEFREVYVDLPIVLGHLRLSLRDIDYCIRLLALAGRGVKGGQPLSPGLFTLLAGLKVTRPELYRQYGQGAVRGAELVDYFDKQSASSGATMPEPATQEWRTLAAMEAALYYADDSVTVMSQLELLKEGGEMDRPEYVSLKTSNLNMDSDAGKAWLDAVLWGIDFYRNNEHNSLTRLRNIVGLIDLYDDEIRR